MSLVLNQLLIPIPSFSSLLSFAKPDMKFGIKRNEDNVGKEENVDNQYFLVFPQRFFPYQSQVPTFGLPLKYRLQMQVNFDNSGDISVCNFVAKGCKPFPNNEILNSSKLKEFAGDKFRFDENGRTFSKMIENFVEKGEIAHHEQFLFFLQCFYKICAADM